MSEQLYNLTEMSEKEKSLIDWVKSIGFVHDAVAISDTVHGRGLVAAEDIPENTGMTRLD